MSLVRMNFFAKSLNMRTDVTAVLPEYPLQRACGEDYKAKFPAESKFPVLYFLNGFTGDYTDGLTMMPVERFVQETGIAVVMPSGLNSWYEDIPGGVHMKTFIARELPAAMEALLPVSDRADRRFLGGISMGARGAALISACYSDYYRATVCLSAPLNLPGLLMDPAEHDKKMIEQSLQLAFGGLENIETEAGDYYAITEKLVKEGRKIPEILFLFGKDDPLYPYQYNRFVRFAERHELPAVCEAWEKGRHDFDFWEPAMKKAMTWLNSKIKIEERTEYEHIQ